MPAYAGSALHFSWVHPGGTVSLHTDFRSMADTESLEIIDATAGADAFREKLPYLKDGQVVLTLIDQSGGSAIVNATAIGTQGTIIYGREGTVVGKPKVTIPAFVSNRQINQPYNDIVEVSVTFDQSSTRTEGAY